MENVIIVESPSKSHTIGSYLGKDFKVVASVGHIRDLATKGKDGLGIDIENDFKPTYEIIKGKSKLVSDLKKTCKGKMVYLATDPDREGEAISYHLVEVLGLDESNYSRIEFHEITKNAVLDAFNHQRKVDMNLVDSQETRRMIDRIIGFRLSKLLQSRIKSKSAGRVQSVALKLIVDLEKEIKAFISTPYYELKALKEDLELSFVSYKDNKDVIVDKNLAIEIKDSLNNTFIVNNVENKQISRQSKPAYTTSTLQQDASNKLNFQASKTMKVAQSLYEGKNLGDYFTGLITYMRTDSTRLADSFVQQAKEYIKNTFGKEFVGNVHKKEQKLAQDAHEAIRVTDINRTPDSIKSLLTNDEYKLYSLIYARTITSLMSNAIDDRTTYTLKNNDTIWRTTYTNTSFKGFEVADPFIKKSAKANKIELNVGDSIDGFVVQLNELFTKPKARYTEATLIKDMEDLGIGRPSTYAQTLTTLKERDYVRLDSKSLVPTEQGILTSDSLDKYFANIINVKYTAKMESKLDDIANGNVKELDELKEFYNDFQPTYEKASVNMEKVAPKLLEEVCPICGSNLCVRKNRRNQEFVGCSNYPKCTYIKAEEKENTDIDTGIICPNCKEGHIVIKTATRGKNKGTQFYACNNFPKCKTTYSDKPINEYCPNCSSILLIDKDGNKYCSNHCSEEKKENSLIDALQEFRSQTFKKLHIKAYNVYNNKELENIANLCPKSIDDLNNMEIFNYNKEDKISKFGQDIIDIVKKHSK